MEVEFAVVMAAAGIGGMGGSSEGGGGMRTLPLSSVQYLKQIKDVLNLIFLLIKKKENEEVFMKRLRILVDDTALQCCPCQHKCDYGPLSWAM